MAFGERSAVQGYFPKLPPRVRSAPTHSRHSQKYVNIKPTHEPRRDLLRVSPCRGTREALSCARCGSSELSFSFTLLPQLLRRAHPGEVLTLLPSSTARDPIDTEANVRGGRHRRGARGARRGACRSSAPARRVWTPAGCTCAPPRRHCDRRARAAKAHGRGYRTRAGLSRG